VSCKDRALLWPDDKLMDCKRNITLPTSRPPIASKLHQINAKRRDKLVSTLQRWRPRTTQRIKDNENCRKMNEQLHLRSTEPPATRRPRSRAVTREALTAVGLDINVVGAAAFIMNARQKEVVIGHLSVYKVEQLIKDRQHKRDEPNVD